MWDTWKALKYFENKMSMTDEETNEYDNLVMNAMPVSKKELAIIRKESRVYA